MSQEQVKTPIHLDSPIELLSSEPQSQSSNNPITQLAQLLNSFYERIENERNIEEEI